MSLIPLAKIAGGRLKALPHPMKVAVMGCEVLSPGSSRPARERA